MPPPGSSLAEVAERVGGSIVGEAETRVGDVTHDSTTAGPGVLFVAVRGSQHDGHVFVPAALAAGAPAVMVDTLHPDAPNQILVGDTRAAMGPAAALVHGDPSHRVQVVGVTGTNGKTTVTHYVESIFTTSGRLAGLIGTIRTRIGDVVLPSAHTTPEAPDFQRLLALMVGAGAEMVAVEVSSHALEMHRVDGTRFAVAAFTNLSQDHLDFHGTMEAYRRAKERLFFEHEPGAVVVNGDDPVGAAIAARIEHGVLTVGSGGELRAEEVDTSTTGTRFRLVTSGEEAWVESPLVGRFNVENALVAAGCCLAVGLTFEEVVAGLTVLPGVPGRFEPVGEGDGPQVVVDYAHTPTGVERAIEAGRAICSGRVIAVVGAGGDRDREKRPLMGRAAAAADLAVITSDNPRSEDPETIVAEVAAGVGNGRVLVEVDRRRAIARAIGEAGGDDLVLILGKGHETGQEVRGRFLPFDDREVARDLLSSARSAEDGPGSGSMVG